MNRAHRCPVCLPALAFAAALRAASPSAGTQDAAASLGERKQLLSTPGRFSRVLPRRF